MDAILEVDGLCAGYAPESNVLDGVQLRVPNGGVACLLGANGVGKTTTLRAISGMIRRSGAITLKGRDISGYKPEQIAALGVSHVPDGRGTIGNLTVEENLLVGGYLVGGRERRERLSRMFQRFPKLEERRHQRAGLLSGGEQQMLAIGRALMQNPQLLLLDEPSFGLSPVMVGHVFAVLKDISRVGDTSIFLVEQNAKIALEFSNTAHLLENGRIVLQGNAADLAQSDLVRKAYLGES
ncbi:ABC transporter ATP-binding protein [Rhizobiaceae sp. 2RAB30]